MSFRYEIQASRNEPMPEGMNAAEQILYQGLCLLHQRFRAGTIGAETAKTERADLEKECRLIEADLKMWKESTKLWKRIEGAVQRYRENPSIEHANSLIDTIYRCKHNWRGTDNEQREEKPSAQAIRSGPIRTGKEGDES